MRPMKEISESKALRALLSGMLSSGLTNAELRQFARQLLSDPQVLRRVAIAVNASIDALECDDFEQDTVIAAPRSQKRWSDDSVEKMTERIVAAADARGWTRAELIEILRTLAPPTWDPMRRGGTREIVQSLLRLISPSDALMIVDKLQRDTPSPDQYLEHILSRRREP